MSEPPLLADHAARARFATGIGENLAVCAGAGTGKTTAISARIARLVLEDARLGTDASARLIVVTYTKAAAAELRARALAAALTAVRNPAAAGHPDLSVPPTERAQRALAGLQRAFFGTIHAFCLTLLQQHGAEAGLPPDPTLQDEDAMELLAERFRQSEFAEAVAVPPELLRFVRYEEILQNLASPRAAGLTPPLGPPPRPSLAQTRALAVKGNGAENIRKTKAAAARWLEAWDAGRHFLGLPQLHGTAKAAVVAHEADLAALTGWIEAARAAVEGDFARAFDAYRLREEVLDFDDLIRRTRDLLAEQPEVLDTIRREQRLVLLDEAQDTGRTMFEILTEIVRPPGSTWGTWLDHPEAGPPRPGAFSLVGDDQQSVYREKARPEDFAEYSEALVRAGGRQLDLSVTMRCDHALVGFVNAVFAERNVPLAAAAGAARFRQLSARPAAGPGAVWRLVLPPPPAPFDGKQTVEATRRAEARSVVDWLAQIGPQGLGVETWGDIAIIAPRKRWLEPVEAALHDHGIPVRSRAAVRLARTLPAWSWPVALLHVLAEPWDRFELIGVLRDLFGISDADLLRAHRRSGLDLTRAPDPSRLPPAVTAALTVLHELHQIALTPETTGVGLLDAIVARTALTGRLATVEAAGDALAVLREQAALTCHTGEPWRNWVRGQVAALERQPPELPPLADGVELIGAQKAKGLQWKVVIVLGLGQGVGEQRSCPEEERPVRDAELRRFFYVTLTRAREKLILPDTTGAFHPPTHDAAPSYTALLGHLAECVQALPEAPVGTGGARPEPPNIEQPVIPWEAAARASRPPARRLLPADTTPHRVVPDGPGPLLESTGGREYGTWLHDWVARLPWRGDRAARQAWRDRALDATTDARVRRRGEEELHRLLECAELLALVETGAQLAPEVPLTYALPGPVPRWLQGTMDLLVLDGRGGALVLDWKTDRPEREESPAEFAERLRFTHERQLALYAAALREGAGLRVSRTLLYSTATGRLIECPEPRPEPPQPARPASYQQMELFG